MSPRIFIVNDDYSCRNLIKEMVKNEGYSNLMLFSHPYDVIEAVQNGDHPRLVISDFEMPELNGVALLYNLVMMVPSISGIIVNSDIEAALQRTDYFPLIEKSDSSFYNRLAEFIKKSIV